MKQPATAPNQQGFTIIEVLIVLGIAGLIFSLIFLAIPALLRSSRNNQRQQDVVTILAAVSRYELNNSASFPSVTERDILLQYTPPKFYETTSITLDPNDTSAPTDKGPVIDIDKVTITDYAVCDPKNIGKSTALSTDYRDIVALYAIETSSGSGFASRCAQL